MGVTLRQLRYFTVVAEELSFTRAAARLHLSQPALSVQIRHLERDVGADLLRRTSRSVELTEAGRRFHDDLRRVLADLDAACAGARRTHQAAPAVIRVAYTASVAYEALPLILDAVADEAPSIAVTADQAWSTRAIEALRSGDADLALVREFGGGDGLVAHEIRRERLAAAMSGRHALASRERLTADALRGRTMVVVPEALAPGFHALVRSLCERRGFAAQEVDVPNVENREPLWAHLVRHPDRLFVGPASMATLAWSDIVYVPLVDPEARIGLSVVHRPGPDPTVERVLDVIGAVAAREDWGAPAR